MIHNKLLWPRRLPTLSARYRYAYTTTVLPRLNQFLQVSEEVSQALAEKRPVVALESAVYTHGFPVPDNLKLAREMEAAVRESGAVPATICVMGGKALVGLSASEVQKMTEAAGKPGTVKCSRRDLAYLTGVQKSYIGGTTIAGTSLIAHMAGIKVFATGGLGGVHRGVAETWDVSADLTELGRTPVAVISGYAKAFLDLEKTLEYLETEGVYVGTLTDKKEGEKVMMPAFYSREGEIVSPSVIRSPKEAAELIYASHALGLQSGQLLANPIPAEAEIPYEQMKDIINGAVAKARDDGVIGKDVTPYILNDIMQRTGGSSIKCNRALLVNNAVMGGKVAAELAKLEGYKFTTSSTIPHIPAVPATFLNTPLTPPPSRDPMVVVLGGIAVDLSCDYTPPRNSTHTKPTLHTSNPSTTTETLGGVAANVAHALHLCRIPTLLISSVGADLAGSWVKSQLSARGMDTSGIVVSKQHPTARYVAVNNADNSLFVAAADMAVIETYPPSSLALPPSAQWVIADGNLSPTTLRAAIILSAEQGAKFIFEPTSTAKSVRIFHSALPTSAVFAAAPNELELDAMYAAADAAGLFSTKRGKWWPMIESLRLGDDFRDLVSRLVWKMNNDLGPENKLGTRLQETGVMQKAVQLSPYIRTQLIKLGANGVLVVRLLDAAEDVGTGRYEMSWTSVGEEAKELRVGGVAIRWFPPEKVVGGVVSVNGAGDTFLGVWVAGMVMGDGNAVTSAQKAAVMTLGVKEAVSRKVGELLRVRGE